MKKLLFKFSIFLLTILCVSITFASDRYASSNYQRYNNVRTAADNFSYRHYDRQRQIRQRQNRRAYDQRRDYYDYDYTDEYYDEPQYEDTYYDNRRSDYEYYDEYRQPEQRHTTSKTVRYNEKLCETGKYKCIKIKRGDKWSKLFPDEYQRDLVKRFNRTNMKLRIGSHYAIPPNLENTTLVDIAPMDKKINNNGKKLIIVNLPMLAFGAYNEKGDLVYWGPVSGGRDWCNDVRRPCKTIRGAFSVFNKEGAKCRSRSFPVDRGGGAPMPYCMFFHTGYALHGSHEVPGYNASHGCVRMYTKDAKWLNEQFVDLPMSDIDSGTEVIVQTDEGTAVDAHLYNSNTVNRTESAHSISQEHYDDSHFVREPDQDQYGYENQDYESEYNNSDYDNEYPEY